MACSSSGQSDPSENSSDEFDDMFVILDLLNLKIANKQPGDNGFHDDNEFCNILENTIFESGNLKDTEEIKKWKKYAEFLEKRALETETNFIELKSEKKKIQKVYDSSKGQVLELMKQTKDYKKQITDLNGKLEKKNKDFEKMKADFTEQIRQLTSISEYKIAKLTRENMNLKGSVQQSSDKAERFQDKVVELEKRNKKIETELQNKVHYLKEVERIMDQQQQVLRNSKDKHKKVKEELQDKIVELELGLGAKDIEIEKLKGDLEGEKLKRQKLTKTS